MEIKDLDQGANTKRKQWVYLGLAILIIVLLSTLGIWLAERPSGNKDEFEKGIDGAAIVKPQKPPESISFTAPKIDPADSWRGIEGNKISDLEKANKTMEDRLNALLAVQQAKPSVHTPDVSPLPSAPSSGKYTPPSKLPPPPPAPSAGGVNYTPAYSESNKNAATDAYRIPAVGIETAIIASNTPAANNGGANGGAIGATGNKAKVEVLNARTYLPAGSYVRALILGGLDAPTGGQSQNNPQPILLRLIDPAALPNRFKSDVRECVMFGSGYGDISTERAALHIESLSCILKNGNALDVAAQGYVVGEDGKAGVRGRLVSKQGQLIANTLIAGMLSGFGQVVSASSNINQTTALGTTTTVDTDKALQAGLGKGTSNAMERLAQYYINLAEKIFPVIEIDAGRVVEVVLSKGLQLELATATEGGTRDGETMSDLVKKFRARQNGDVTVLQSLGIK